VLRWFLSESTSYALPFRDETQGRAHWILYGTEASSLCNAGPAPEASAHNMVSSGGSHLRFRIAISATFLSCTGTRAAQALMSVSSIVTPDEANSEKSFLPKKQLRAGSGLSWSNKRA
jgi:hypothetical protein